MQEKKKKRETRGRNKERDENHPPPPPLALNKVVSPAAPLPCFLGRLSSRGRGPRLLKKKRGSSSRRGNHRLEATPEGREAFFFFCALFFVVVAPHVLVSLSAALALQKPHKQTKKLLPLPRSAALRARIFACECPFDRLVRSNASPGGCLEGAERGRQAIGPQAKKKKLLCASSASSWCSTGRDDPARPRRLVAPAAAVRTAPRRPFSGAESGPGAVDGAVCTGIGSDERKLCASNGRWCSFFFG